jgi:GTP-binding protein
MDIKKAQFVMSNTDFTRCPKADRPEYAFIGRSNVGKSSLINMLANQKGLAKTSSRPGKTQLINHFIMNEEWYLVDLPGYGYAKVSKQSKKQFQHIITSYLRNRKNLLCVCVLIDSRHEPQQIDIDFMYWLGENMLPFAMVFTKTDKLKPKVLEENIALYKEKMLETWVELPPMFLTSAEAKEGRDELLSFISDTNKIYSR